MTSLRTFTLDQLVFFSETGMERPTMLRAMRALYILEDSCFVLCSSDSTRDRNVVRLYQDHGAVYGPQLVRYIDSMVGAQPPAARPGAPRYTLGQLAWIHAVGFFRDDMVRDMLASGVPAETAAQLAASAAQHRSILGVWRECGQQHGEVLERYLESQLGSYTPGWPHAQPSADFLADDEAQHSAP